MSYSLAVQDDLVEKNFRIFVLLETGKARLAALIFSLRLVFCPAVGYGLQLFRAFAVEFVVGSRTSFIFVLLRTPHLV